MMRPVVVKVGVPLGLYAFQLFWDLGGKIQNLSLSTPEMALSTRHNTTFEREMSNFDATHTINWRKKRQNDKWFDWKCSSGINLGIALHYLYCQNFRLN